MKDIPRPNTRQILLAFLLTLPVQLRADANTGDATFPPPSTWITTPGDLRVIMHTDAWFNWTHTILDNVDIEWQYWDNRGPVTMMKHENNITTTFTNGDTRYQRVRYISFAGSAVMVMRNVTPLDSGIYWVRLASSNMFNPNDYSSTASLEVIPESDINVVIDINGHLYDVAVSKNGTNITLPSGMAHVSTPVHMGVDVTNSTPIPSSIRFVNRLNGDSFEDVLCKRARFCEREVTYHTYQKYKKLYITIFIDFQIQHLDVLEITCVVILLHEDDNKWTQTPGQMFVMENTTARFTWTHAFDNINVKSWFCRLNNQADDMFIMNVVENETWIFAAYKDRLSYIVYPGSMTMTLSKVETADTGEYRAIVSQGNTQKQNFDAAQLTVVKKADIWINIVLQGERFVLRIDQNGTEISLPVDRINIPTYYGVTVETLPSTLTPFINANTTFETDIKMEPFWEITNIYQGGILIDETSVHREIQINVTISFDVQNLDVVKISRDIILDNTNCINNSKVTLGKKVATFAGNYLIHLSYAGGACLLIGATIVIMIIFYKRWQTHRSNHHAGECSVTETIVSNPLFATSDTLDIEDPKEAFFRDVTYQDDTSTTAEQY